jgi:hypothetical protein
MVRKEGEQRGEQREEEIRVRQSLIFDAQLICGLEISKLIIFLGGSAGYWILDTGYWCGLRVGVIIY